MNDNQSFQVMRVNHKEKVSEALESMFLEESLCDVTICCCGQQVKAHRVILAASSLYFKEIFAATLPGQYPIVFVKSITVEDLNAILEFIYKGEVTVPHEQLESLVTSAECLGVLGLGKLNVDEAKVQNGVRPCRPELPLAQSVVAAQNGDSAISSPSRSEGNSEQMVSTRKSASAEAEAKQRDRSLSKKRGKKRKTYQVPESDQQDVKPVIEAQNLSSSGKTNGHNGHTSSPASTSSSTSSSNRKSSSPTTTTSTAASTSRQSQPPAAHGNSGYTNGHHKMAQQAASPEPMDAKEDTDAEEEEKLQRDEQYRTRRNTMPRANGHRSREVIQDKQDTSPSVDSDVEVEVSGQNGEKEHRMSNGSLDLTRKKGTDEGQTSTGGAPKTKTITKSKLRSWSQQISQSAGPVAEQQTPKGLSLKLPPINLNLAAIKSEINEQLSASTSGNQGSSSTDTPNGSRASTPTVFKTNKIVPLPVETKPDSTLNNIPSHIKIEARPRGRPRKSITANAAIVPRPLNPILGLARSSLAAKVAAASAVNGSPGTSSPVSAPPSTSASPATPSTPAAPSDQASPITPIMRIENKRLGPSSTPTVTIVNGSGTVLSTMTASTSTAAEAPYSSDRAEPTSRSSSAASTASETSFTSSVTAAISALGAANPEQPVKKRRGRPPASSNLNTIKLAAGSAPRPIAPRPEPRVPSLTLKIPNQFAHFLKTPSVMAKSSTQSTAKLSQTPVITNLLQQGASSSTSSSAISASATSASSSTSSSSSSIPSNPSASAHAPTGPRPQPAHMATISSGAVLPATAGLTVPRFTPIVTQDQQQQHQQQPQAEQSRPEAGST